jgi:hypothetical protein
VHLRDGDTAKDRTLLLTAILADAIDLGLNRMADACPGTSLSRLRVCPIRPKPNIRVTSRKVGGHRPIDSTAFW